MSPAIVQSTNCRNSKACICILTSNSSGSCIIHVDWRVSCNKDISCLLIPEWIPMCLLNLVDFFSPVSRKACCIGTPPQLLIFITCLEREDADQQVFKHLVASNRKMVRWTDKHRLPDCLRKSNFFGNLPKKVFLA